MIQKYHNPDPLLWLIGLANEATILIEGQQFLALIDSGAQLSTMSELLVQALKLPIHKLNTLIEAEVSGGGITPYTRYVEARLTIPGIKQMDKDSLFMVTNDSPYTQRVPIQLGTLHIREAMQLATKKEKQSLSSAWETASFAPQALSKAGILNESNFNLSQVDGKVKLTKAVVIKPFQTVHVSGHTESNQHFKRVNVIVESDPKRDYGAAILINGYTVLKPGSSCVSVGFRNISCQCITILAKTVIVKIAAANVVPHSYAPNVNNEQLQKLSKLGSENIFINGKNTEPEIPLETPPLTPEREQLLFSKINLDGIKDWTDDLKTKIQELFKEYAHIFTLESLDMGHTSLVKHKIKLDNYTPFKERYRHIPPNLFEEVKNHLKEMLQVGAIRHSNSPWASAVVLVRKKDGSLWFCIDLR